MTDWFARSVLQWAERHGRTDLPWQLERTPYRVWVAEIMLQQTQVQTVIPYFERFMSSLPTVSSLAGASRDDVMSLWTGLGYYRRARLLHQAATEIVTEHNGQVPNSLDALVSLPGIGRSTAGAILSSGFNQRGVILDGNVKRVLARFHAVEGELRRTAVLNQLWTLAETHTPTECNAEYAQAIMDLGAICCTKNVPNCSLCPIHTRCKALRTDKVEHFPNKSRRQSIRDESLRLFLVIDGKGRSLLQRQPEDGLWGGLWLPLRVEGRTDFSQTLARVGINDGRAHREETIPFFMHTLSHVRFKVHATVVYLSNTPRLSPSRDDLVWFDTSISSSIGLSKLTLTLLEKARKCE
ncbi:MAG: A/G-specific adenine glycosylase [Gammaproteobacteria bacterium]|nr:A/G-specific adenine glycosylase [Gammaproteobacteria bacterium]